MSVNLQQWLNAARIELQAVSSSPDVDAEWLLMAVLKQSRAYLYAHPEHVLTEEQTAQCQELLQRRSAGEPLAYLVGHKEFWSLDLCVSSATLIPRPETELLVETVLNLLPKQQSLQVADLGTGSGAIALALAKERPKWQLYATDLSVDALSIAQLNAKRLGLSNIVFAQGNWCNALPTGSRFNAIMSNPPYLGVLDPHLHQGDIRFEPYSALVSGQSGLEAFHSIISQAPEYLDKEGYLLLEHGYNQQESLMRLLKERGFAVVQGYKDLAGLERMIVAHDYVKIQPKI